MTKIGNYETNKIRSMMTLFKAVPGDALDDNMPEIAMASLEDCVLKGFVFVNQNGQVLPFITMPLFVIAEQIYGIDKEINNQTFWKSFERVRDMDPREYVLAQIAHYFSTYGMEFFGLNACPFVPLQDLDIPDTMLPYNRLTVIRLVSGSMMLKMIDNYALNTVSPSPDRIEQFKPLMEYLTISTDSIKSFELQVIKHDLDGTVPTNPQSFLRYLVYKTTNTTLMIKNRAMYQSIKTAATNSAVKDLPYKYFSKADLCALASIFFRYRPIFLAFKKFDGCAPIINRIRRLADTHHVPMSDVSVQNLSALVLANRYSDAMKVVDKTSNRELIKLFNFFNEHIRVENVPGVYNIRNGRTFVNENAKSRDANERAAFLQMSRVIRMELTHRLSKALGGKVFYIPDYIEYTAPITEKQFIGNIPWGSRILGFNSNDALTIGVSWFDQKNQRVDIDLHLNSATKHYGWCGSYIDGEDIIYTGDMTSAPLPNGAAEAYYFNPKDDKYIASVNLFSGPSDAEFKMYMTSKKPLIQSYRWDTPYTPYTFDPKDALFAPIPLKFNNTHGMTLGMFAEGGFYFYGGGISSGVVPRGNYSAFIDGLVAKLDTQITIDELLGGCGVVILDDKEFAAMADEEKKTVISLAPEDLTATTLLDIIDGNI